MKQINGYTNIRDGEVHVLKLNSKWNKLWDAAEYYPNSKHPPN